MNYSFDDEVPGAGIEPAWLAPGDFKSPVSTSFTTRAGAQDASTCEHENLEAPSGIEPLYEVLQTSA